VKGNSVTASILFQTPRSGHRVVVRQGRFLSSIFYEHIFPWRGGPFYHYLPENSPVCNPLCCFTYTCNFLLVNCCNFILILNYKLHKFCSQFTNSH